MRFALLVFFALAAAACSSVSSQELSTAEPQSAPLITPTRSAHADATSTPTRQSFLASRRINEFAYARSDGTVWLASADGSVRRQIISESLGNAHKAADAVAWSPDGRFLAYSTQRGTLEILDMETGDTRVLDDGSDGPTSDLAYPVWCDNFTISYTKTTSDTSVPGARSRWKVTLDGKKSQVPGPSQTDVDGLYCYAGTPLNDILLCSRLPEGHQGYGRQLYLKWPNGNLQQISENGEAHSWSPDGHWLAYFDDARGGSTMTGEIHVLELETGRDIELGTFNSDDSARWAPVDGRVIFDNLEINPVTGEVTELFARPYTGLSWSPDVSKVEFITEDGDSTLYDLSSKTETILATFKITDAHRRLQPAGGLAWSPNSRYLLFLQQQGDMKGRDGVLSVIDTANYAIHRVINTNATLIRASYSPDSTYLLIGQEITYGLGTIFVSSPDGSTVLALDEGAVPRRGAWRPNPEG